MPNKLMVILIVLVTLLLLALSAMAQSGYDGDWWTIDGGGYAWSEGGGYSLGGTLGQPDAGVLSNGGYTLAGGYWSGLTAHYGVYLPLVVKNH